MYLELDKDHLININQVKSITKEGKTVVFEFPDNSLEFKTFYSDSSCKEWYDMFILHLSSDAQTRVYY